MRVAAGMLVVMVATAHADAVFEFHDPMSKAVSKLTVGRVLVRDRMLEVNLSDLDPGCGPPTGPPHRPSFSFPLPPGPGGSYFAGAKFGVPAFAATEQSMGMGLGSQGIAITVAPFKLAADVHVRGTIDVGDYGTGTFDAIVCPQVDASKLRALPKTAPDKPFSGTAAGGAFAMRSAFATVDRQSDSYTTLLGVQMFAEAGVTCATRDKAKGRQLRLADIGGASTSRKLVGSPQPAIAGLDEGSFDRDAVWVQLDKLSFKPGDTIAGRAVVDAPGTSLGGTFTAPICGR